MANRITVRVVSGASFASDDDRNRAEDAALTVLHGVDPSEAYAEFKRQVEAVNDDEYTGLAALWWDAQRAADVALTEGWIDPEGAFCELIA
jgi:hypothetical protein